MKGRKQLIEVSCDWCGKRGFKMKEFLTPHGAVMFSCGKKKCNTEMNKTFIDLWSNG